MPNHDTDIADLPEIEAARAPASLSTVSVSQETSAMWDDEHSIQSLDRFAG